MTKTKSKREYFTKVHEDAIVRYCTTRDRYEKDKLYADLIHPAFDEMVDKIIYTYKFNTLPNVDYLREECKAWLVTILDKYDPNKGSKAFSYFSVVTKNWFIHKVKKTTKQLKTETSIEEENVTEEPLWDEMPYDVEREKKEFFQHLMEEIDHWYSQADKENEVKVLDAIKVLFQHSEQIEIFNKKAIYLYMREITDLNTKQIATVLTKMKSRYREFKDEWDDGEI